MNSIIYTKYVKRILDFFLSISGLIILSPLLLIIALIIKSDSDGPVLFKQKRVGQNEKLFNIYKFRTMYNGSDKFGSTNTQFNDFRITNVGKILRKFSLDELPQLFNVLLGTMSIVGYRPGTKFDYDETDRIANLFKYKPGITGYAQVNGRSSLNLSEKRYWESKYVEDISFLVDCKIIIQTIGAVFCTKNAN